MNIIPSVAVGFFGKFSKQVKDHPNSRKENIASTRPCHTDHCRLIITAWGLLYKGTQPPLSTLTGYSAEVPGVTVKSINLEVVDETRVSQTNSCRLYKKQP